jgi:hypothetical protein
MSFSRGAAQLGVAAALLSAAALAGPPYATDDPEPVEFRHWELYLASQDFHDRDGWNGTAPHFEVNYGVVTNVQLHLIAPLAYSAPDGGTTHYGYGDTEVGVKFRFVREGDWVPQVGTFPLVEVPTGSIHSGLGNGTTQVYVPLWLQKEFGKWTTYGGAGLWLDASTPVRHWWFIGALLQRELVEGVTVGAEIFHLTPATSGDESDTRFNIGAVLDITDAHHILLSAGRGFEGPNLFQSYVAYQATLGPAE